MTMGHLLIIVSIVASIITGALGFGLHKLDVARIEAKYTHKLEKQAKGLRQQCEREKAITTEVSRDYQKDIDRLNKRLSARRLQRPAACVAVAAGTAGGRDGTARSATDGRTHGIDAQSLRDFSGDAETYRLRLIACQAFVDKTWHEYQRK